ncbi:MAG: GGDEF domain-containing protein, partial [Defluviitaleaceae bacterium]|nr:GGDEF domain-containing protein [Defluviitaleaceae bacterium]
IVELFTKANYDALTGIHNRHFLETAFQSVTHILSRSGGRLSVFMIDIDFFKNYNDKYGHDKGDSCLKAVAQTLSDTIPRKGDFVARYGGEEFIAVLPNTDEAGARLIANRLLDSVRSLKMPHAASDASEFLTISIGVTSGKVSYSQNCDDFIKRADEALYSAKQGGRDRYIFLPLVGAEFSENG